MMQQVMVMHTHELDVGLIEGHESRCIHTHLKETALIHTQATLSRPKLQLSSTMLSTMLPLALIPCTELTNICALPINGGEGKRRPNTVPHYPTRATSVCHTFLYNGVKHAVDTDQRYTGPTVAGQLAILACRNPPTPDHWEDHPATPRCSGRPCC